VSKHCFFVGLPFSGAWTSDSFSLAFAPFVTSGAATAWFLMEMAGDERFSVPLGRARAV
jgi:hypothetical protein